MKLQNLSDGGNYRASEVFIEQQSERATHAAIFGCK
jgi:hypothetical protein